MKAGSTTLFRWLEAHPDTELGTKEPEFFNRSGVLTEADVDRYRASFPVREGAISGEASVAYLDPRAGAAVAMRMKTWVPSVKLVCLLREPAARLRSHHRHEVLRGREKRSLAVALEDPGNPYLARSLYHTALTPFVTHFAGQLLVLPSERLFGDSDADWERVLQFLGLAPMPRPRSVHNASNAKRAFRGPMLKLWEWGAADYARWVPAGLRNWMKRALLRSPDETARLRQKSDVPLPRHVVHALAVETGAVCRLLDWSEDPWRAGDGPGQARR